MSYSSSSNRLTGANIGIVIASAIREGHVAVTCRKRA
jgi:hypothetical protein